jgi:trimeric autotransporter adhesin
MSLFAKHAVCSRGVLLVLGLTAGAIAAGAMTGCSNGSGASIGTVAGTGQIGNAGNGGLATAAMLGQPSCVALDSAGNMYIGDADFNVVRKVTAATGIISAYVGVSTGIGGYGGDGGLATNASLEGPSGCVLDSAGNLYISDEANNVVRKVTASTGIISTVAGNGDEAGTAFGGSSGDGGLATHAELNHPWGLAMDSAGDLFIADTGNYRIQEVNASTGIITTVASLHSGANPEGLALDGAGNLYIAEQGDPSDVVKLNLSTGALTVVAGNGTSGSGGSVVGDGGRATSAVLSEPQGVAVDAAGNIFISDTGDQRVREVTASTGIITSVVGTTMGYSTGGGSATHAQLHNPGQIFFDAAGELYIADTDNGAVRKVTGLN